MKDCVVFDIETTGFYPDKDKITEIGAVKIKNGKISEVFNQLINPEVLIPSDIIRLTGIDNNLVADKPTIDIVIPRFLEFCEEAPVMGHNIIFDFSFIKANAALNKLRFEKTGIDTLMIARTFLQGLERRSLEHLCNHYNIERAHAHRAYDDALATYEVFLKMRESFYNDVTKEHFEPKPIHWKPKKQEPITKKQEKYLQDLIKKNNIKLIKPINEYSKSEASREIDSIINKYGRTFSR